MTASMFRRGLAVAGLACAFGAASATVTFDFNGVFTGDTPVGGTPWATLTIQNDGTDSGLNKVLFTLTNNTDPGSGQFLTELELNMTSIPNDFAFVIGSDSPSSRLTGISFGEDFLTDAGEKFDFDATFNIPNNGNRVIGGTSVSWDMKGTGLDESFFNTFATPHGENPDNILALLHIQGIPGDGEGSSKVTPVPEPASMAGLALGALALLRKRRK
jgi:hypothetical protein